MHVEPIENCITNQIRESNLLKTAKIELKQIHGFTKQIHVFTNLLCDSPTLQYAQPTLVKNIMSSLKAGFQKNLPHLNFYTQNTDAPT